MNNINWYPGHMKKTRELIRDHLKLVDMVIEVIDARIPRSSRNPIIDELVAGKPRIIALNKKDLADPEETKKWIRVLQKDGSECVELNCMTGDGIRRLYQIMAREQTRLNKERQQRREESGAAIPVKSEKPLRLMIVGVPNVGKSSLINRLTGKKSTQTGDRPGVTKGKQWLTLSGGMQLLDTPGILWPKFEDQNVGLALAYCGSIRDEILDIADLALSLIGELQENYPQLLMERYKLDVLGDAP